MINRSLSTEECTALRQRLLSEAHGHVLEIGFGSGLNLPHYPSAVRSIQAVEPCQGARRLAKKMIEDSGRIVQFAELEDDAIVMPSHSVDLVVSTWTLCTILDINRALLEMRRVLKPEGRFLFLEHGRAAEKDVAKWQDRLTPFQKKIGGGCHLNRKIDRLIREAQFSIDKLETFYTKGPRAFSFHYMGAASVMEPEATNGVT